MMLFSRFNTTELFVSMKPIYLLSFFLLAILIQVRPLNAQDTAPLVVMNLAAHPDDEDGRTLTYYRRAKNAMAYSIIYTRGEGGQNEIGPQLYEELGALRSEETERAARILGTQTYFLNFKDFGYSKKASEAFEKWGGEDEVTGRIVYLIRKLKPDVLFTNHDTLTVGPRTQHGQHQAVGISTYNAFELAADPTYRPDQLEEEGVDLWQPKRLFLRRWFGARDGDYEVVVPVTDVDRKLEKSYAQIATAALVEHASQGMGNFAGFRRMQDNTHFTLLRSSTDAPMDSSDLAFGLPANTAAKPSLDFWIDSGRVPPIKEGFLFIDDEIVVPGQTLNVKAEASVYPGKKLRIEFTGPIDTTLVVAPDEAHIAALPIDSRAAPTLPKPDHQYNRFTNHPPVVYGVYEADTDELLGAGYIPLEISPPMVMTITQDVIRLQPGANEFSVLLTMFDPQANRAHMRVSISEDERNTVIYSEPFEVSFETGTAQIAPIKFDLPDTLTPGNYTIKLTGIAAPSILSPAPVHKFISASVFSVEVAQNLRVGVIESYDNTLATALDELQVDYVKLDSAALASQSYEDLHTIVVDIRSYLVRSDLRRYNDDLLDWVSDGGHMIVNYQKMFEWNSQYDDPFVADQKNPEQLAPYPLQLSRDRVTREDAAVTLLAPELPIFHAPNPISNTLWDNWVQERGLYFPGEYSSDYQELFEMGDPGEEPLRSSTLFARHGEGTYVYTALGWYRQLKVYHPDVYAFFANMISLPLVEDNHQDTTSSDSE